MADALPTPVSCCETCGCPESPTTIPGPQGPVGPTGADGTDGINAFTTVKTATAIPAWGGSGNLIVNETAWMVPIQTIYISGAGYFRVTTIIDSNTVNVYNWGYPGNANASGNFIVGRPVSPGGIKGLDGTISGTAGGDLTGTYPNPQLAITSIKGDIIASTGGAGANTALSAGANGTRLVADSTQPTGLKYAKVNLAATAEITGITAVGNGGTGLSAGTSGGIPAYTATNAITSSAALANYTPIVGGGAGAVPRSIAGPGTAGQVLTSNGAAADPTFQSPAITGVVKDLVYFSCLEASGTAGNGGGNFSSGSWSTRFMTNLVVDTTGAASVGANQMTLPAGTWRFHCRAPGYHVDGHKLRLYNITTSASVQEGSNATASAASGVQTDATVQGRVTIGVATIFELQHRCATTRNADGFGQATSLGSFETYGECWFEREAA